MNKIFLIIQREYISRVKKKSFIVMTILTPLLVVAFYGIIIYFAVNKDVGEGIKHIYVCDSDGNFAGKIHSNKLYQFTFGTALKSEFRQLIDSENYAAVFVIPSPQSDSLIHPALYYLEQPGYGMMSYLEGQLELELKNRAFGTQNIDPKILDKINNTKVSISALKITSSGTETGNIAASTALGFFSAFLIYMFIFLYGVQVMRGVIEEKTNRIVEVIMSSVKPFQLMMGKIIGIALVGLTQFVIWMTLVSILGGSTSGIIMSKMNIPVDASAGLQNAGPTGDIGNFMTALLHFNWPLILGMFLFYFIGGYLFYGSLFAAVGSAVDNETDTQQFMLPITLPLVFAFIFAQSAVTANPNSSLAFWLSVIPFTSPIVMMVRIPFGVPLWEIVISVICMIGGFIFTVWMASKIYRIGILMYGKKATYKELGRWIFYRN